MRDLVFADVYKASRIFKKLEIKIDMKNKTQEEIGGELILRIAENLGNAEKEVNEFMGSLIGKTGEEFAKLTFAESRRVFEDFKKLPSLNDFFESVGKLMK